MTTNLARARIDALAKSSRDAHQLARMVSLAAEIDARLIRTLRLRLLPRSDASAEADLWFSELVTARNTRGILLDNDVTVLLREELAQEGLLRPVWDVMSERHLEVSPLVRLEEELLWLALSKQQPEQLESKLGEVLLALSRDSARARDLSVWAHRTLPQLPSAVRQTHAAWLLSLAASARLTVAVNLSGAPPSGMTAQAMPGLLPSEVPEIELELRRIDAHTVHVSDVVTSGGNTAGLRVPNTRPRVLEIIDGDAPTEVIALEAGSSRAITLRDDPRKDAEVTLRTLSGNRWRLTLHDARAKFVRPARPAPGVRWLHLSDPQINQHLAFNWPALKRELDEVGFDGELDLVVLSGDITRQGAAEQFAAARGWLNDLDQAQGAPRLLLPVPGNHDLVDPSGGKDRGGLRTFLDDEPFWFEADHPARRDLRDRFSSFLQWQQWVFESRSVPGFTRGILPGDFSVSLELPIGRVGVVGINNVFGVNPTRRRLKLQAFSPRQFDAVCGEDMAAWRARHDLTLLIGHYPPRALAKNVRGWFSQRIAPCFDVIFSGATDGSGVSELVNDAAGPSALLQVGPFRGTVSRPYRLALGSATRASNGTEINVWSRYWDTERESFAIDQAGYVETDPVTLTLARTQAERPERSGLPTMSVDTAWLLVGRVMLLYHVGRLSADGKDPVRLPSGWSAAALSEVRYDSESMTTWREISNPIWHRLRRTLAALGVTLQDESGNPRPDLEFLDWWLEALVELHEALGQEGADRTGGFSVKIAADDLPLLIQTAPELIERLASGTPDTNVSELFSATGAGPYRDLATVVGFRDLASLYRLAREASAPTRDSPDAERRLLNGLEAQSVAGAALTVADGALPYYVGLVTLRWPALVVRGVTLSPAATNELCRAYPARVFRPTWLARREAWAAAGLCRGDETASEMAERVFDRFDTAIAATLGALGHEMVQLAFRQQADTPVPGDLLARFPNLDRDPSAGGDKSLVARVSAADLLILFLEATAVLRASLPGELQVA
ncbi:MAG: metallophosphoesterase [Pseudomonadota bacterium]